MLTFEPPWSSLENAIVTSSNFHLIKFLHLPKFKHNITLLEMGKNVNHQSEQNKYHKVQKKKGKKFLKKNYNGESR